MAELLPRFARALAARALGAVERTVASFEAASRSTVRPVAAERKDFSQAGIAKGVPSAAPTEEYEDFPVSVWSNWTIASIRGAIVAFVNGLFNQAAILSEAMIADDRIQAAVNGRTKGVTKCEWALEPAKSGKRQQKELQKLLPEMLPPETVEQLLFWAIFLGFALAEIVWESKNDRWVPRLKIWHPLYIYYRIDLRKYVAITTKGQIEIEEGDPKWFLYTPWGSYRGWLRGAVRACAIPWVVRQLALRDWGRFSEVHGLPIKKLLVPSQAPAPDKARFFASVSRLGSEAVFNLPVQGDGKGGVGPSFDVQLLEAKDKSWQAFPGLIHQCERSITLAIRGTNLTTELDGGSFAAADVHRDEDSDYALADRRKLAAAVKTQLFRPYCLFNYGNPELAPEASLNAPESDQEKQTAVLKGVADYVIPLENAGWPIDREVVSKRFGVDLRADMPANKPIEEIEADKKAAEQLRLQFDKSAANDEGATDEDDDAGESADVARDGEAAAEAAE